MELETYTGDGPISYWNAYVAVTQMGGQGQFFDPRIDVAVFRSRIWSRPSCPRSTTTRSRSKRPSRPRTRSTQPRPKRGKALFEGAAQCSTCHSGPALTDAQRCACTRRRRPAWIRSQAERSATGQYRTTPLRALLQHPPYFHDGSAATLADVVDHYDDHLELGLSADEKSDLTEYLKSL